MNTVMAATGFLTGYIVPFILVLSLLVFVHEMGHYLVGRWCGIRSTAFSVGFGPELLGFTDKHGTRWKISAIPLGGYVKFFGDEDAASKPDSSGLSHMTLEERAQTLSGAKLWKRAATVAAGPIANFILAILIFAVLFGIYGRMIADPVVAEVRENSAAAAAGVRPGDRLVAIDGEKVVTFEDVRRYVGIRPGTPITVTVERAGEELKLPMVPTRTKPPTSSATSWKWVLSALSPTRPAVISVTSNIHRRRLFWKVCARQATSSPAHSIISAISLPAA